MCGPWDFRVRWRALNEHKGERVDSKLAWAPEWRKAPREVDPLSYLCLPLALGILFGTPVSKHTGLISRIWAVLLLEARSSSLCPGLN